MVRHGKLFPDFVACIVYFLTYGEEVVCCSFGQAEALEAIRLGEREYIFCVVNTAAYINKLNSIPYLKESLRSTRQAGNWSALKQVQAEEDNIVRDHSRSPQYGGSCLSYPL